jgi:hypothetical protein
LLPSGSNSWPWRIGEPELFEYQETMKPPHGSASTAGPSEWDEAVAALTDRSGPTAAPSAS